MPRVKKFSLNENQNCEKISNNKKTKFTAFKINQKKNMKVILFCTLHSYATRLRHNLMYKYFTLSWWKFVYSPTQTLNLDWYKACIIITIEKFGAYERSNNNEAKWRENPNYNFRFSDVRCIVDGFIMLFEEGKFLLLCAANHDRAHQHSWGI